MLRSPSRMEGRSWATELFARTLKSLFLDAEHKPVQWLRKEMENFSAYHPAVSKAKFETQEIAGVSCTLVSPKEGAGSEKVVLYFHGGGYVVGSPQSYRPTLAEIALNSDALVVAPDYRLAPEHPFPIPQDDCLAVSKAVLRDYRDHVIVLAGDSAGGALAVSTALELNKSEDQRKADGLVLISPWVEPTTTSGTMLSNENNDFLIAPFLAKSYGALIQGGDPDNPRSNFLSADLAGLPQTLIQCGEGELFFDQIQSFSNRAESAGVRVSLQNYPAQFHVFQILSAVLKDAKHAMQEIARFIDSLPPTESDG